MKKKEMFELLKEMHVEGSDVAKIVNKIVNKEKASLVQRLTEQRRREVWKRMGTSNVTYGQMTAYIWDYMVHNPGMVRDWLMSEHPELFDVVPAEVPMGDEADDA